MKLHPHYLFAAFLMLIAASCNKEPLIPDNTDPLQLEPRVLTASYALNETKSTLNGFDPKWAEGDKVMLTDGVNSQEFTLVTSIPGLNEAQIGAEGTQFHVSIPGDWGATIYAIYPSDSYLGIDGGEIEFIIPTNQNGSFSSANICAAKTTDTSLSFKNVTSLVKLNSVETGINTVIIPAVNIAGTYKVNPGNTPTLVSGTGRNSVIISTTGTEFYAAVAPVDVPVNTWLRFEDSNSTIVGAVKTTGDNKFETNKIHNIGDIKRNENIPDGMIKGGFSVSATRRVHFSKGNLQATCVDNTSTPNVYTWSFAENQYDYISQAPGNTTIDSQQIGGVVDLFGWVGSSGNFENTYGIVTEKTKPQNSPSDNYGKEKTDVLKNDWGELIEGEWYTMSQPEWEYLMNTRTVNGGTGEGYSYQRTIITVSESPEITRYGMLLAPDNYDSPLSTTYSYSEWISAEASGCVFLPSAGTRWGATNIGFNEQIGFYWTSTCAFDSTNAASPVYNIYFDPDSVLVDDISVRPYGFSVRLATPAS